jgi:hypothetical protein
VIPLNITQGVLRLDWDSHGTLTIARTDNGQSAQLSVSEWEFLLRAALLAGVPTYPPVPCPVQPS